MKHLSFFLLLVFPLVTFFAGYASGQIQEERGGASSTGTVDLMAILKMVQLVRDEHIDGQSLTQDELLSGALKGVVSATHDPYSEYFTAEEAQEFNDALRSELSGIGAEVGMREDRITVIAPLPGSPAEKAGVRAGDYIFKIDGTLTVSLSVSDAVERIRGETGTEVELTLLREGDTEPRVVRITRDTIHIDSVHQRVEGAACIVQVSIFGEATIAETEKALTACKADAKVKGIVLDVRNNGGGLLDGARSMVSFFQRTGEVVRIRERGEKEEVMAVTGTALVPDMPLVVLVNEGSASASEIVAGALQESGRAKLVGRKTFGKGSVQEVRQPFSGGAMVKLTVAKWYTPKGRDVTKDAIVPDIEVPFTPADADAGTDPQLARAIAELAAK